MQRLPSLVAAALLVIPVIAAAEVRPLKLPGTAALGELVAGPATVDDLVFARQVLPPGETQVEPGAVALAQSRIIYLNKNGVTLQPGVNDARTNRSTIAGELVSVPAWNVSATTWSATVACMRDLFAAYDVQVVDADPGNVPHMEAVFGGSPTLFGMPENVAGVSPFTTDCSIIENSIVFTFTDVIPADPRLACEIMAQEVAHSYGLDHELLAADPMTYLAYNGNRAFQNQSAACGESAQRPCGINGSVCRPNQNSVALLTERLGRKANDTVPPTASITSPTANATVPPGFAVYASASDNLVVASATLYVDDVAADQIASGGPYTFSTPDDLAEGPHALRIEVSDGTNVVQTQEIMVTVQRGATPPPPPDSGSGAGAGPDAPGGIEVTGGCAAGGGGSSLALGLALLGLRRRRR